MELDLATAWVPMPSQLTAYENAYYYVLRKEARRIIAASIDRKVSKSGHWRPWSNLTLASINEEAIAHARREWPKYYSDDTHHGFTASWERLYFKFNNRPSFFDLAIWQVVDGTRVLQALALGKPSNAKTHLTVNWVERSFAPTYIRSGVLLPILGCAEEYAKLLGCQRVLVKDAVDPTKYERYGYTPYRIPRIHADYLCKELKS